MTLEVGKKYHNPIADNYFVILYHHKVKDIYFADSLWKSDDRYIESPTLHHSHDRLVPYVKTRKVTRYGYWYKPIAFSGVHPIRTAMYGNTLDRDQSYQESSSHRIPGSQFEISIEVEE